MLKRIIYITFIVLLAGAFAYFYIQMNRHSEVKTESDILEVLPNNPAIIAEIPELNTLVSNQEWPSEMWNTLEGLGPLKEYNILWRKWDNLSKTVEDLTHWTHHPAVFSYHTIGNNTNTFFAIKFSNKAAEKAWELMLKSQEISIEKKYNGVEIFKLGSGIESYACFHSGYFTLSDSPILLEQSIRHLAHPHPIDEDFERLRKTKGSDCDINFMVNYARLKDFILQHSHKNSPFVKRFQHLGQWGEYDFSVKNDRLVLNGFSSYSESDYWQIFSQQESEKISIIEAIPSDKNGFISLCISYPKDFRSDYENYLNATDKMDAYQSWIQASNKLGFENIHLELDQLLENELARCYDNRITAQSNESLVVLKTHSATQTQEVLELQLQKYAQKKGHSLSRYTSTFRLDNATTFSFYNFPLKDIFPTIYGDAFRNVEVNYVSLYDNYLIFAKEKNSLKKALTSLLLKQNYENDATFYNTYSNFSSKSSVFYFEKVDNILPKVKSQTSEKFCTNNKLTPEDFSKFYALSYQMVNSGSYVYNSLMLEYKPGLKEKPTTVWSSQLDGAPIGKPSFVLNHYTKENEICIQDDLNNLYLISNSGRIIWKKAIGEKIISDIHQIDFYKNGKLQLLFNTAYKLWLLDRDGNFVERYPILLSSPATTGLSLFDYDKNRNYRIFVPTQDKKILLFNKEGNINKGFEFKGSEETITSPIQFFRVASKDYLVTADKNRVYILNRKGQERVKLKEQFSASANNSFYLGRDERSYLATTDHQGLLKKIYFDGSVKTIELNTAGAKHFFALDKVDQTGNDNYITVEKGQLNVYNFRGRILYSKRFENALLSRPYFYRFSNQEIKIGITDMMNNEIHLVNGEDGNYYEGFPLVGTTPFTIGFLKASSWRFNLIVGGENNALYNYRVK